MLATYIERRSDETGCVLVCDMGYDEGHVEVPVAEDVYAWMRHVPRYARLHVVLGAGPFATVTLDCAAPGAECGTERVPNCEACHAVIARE